MASGHHLTTTIDPASSRACFIASSTRDSMQGSTLRTNLEELEAIEAELEVRREGHQSSEGRGDQLYY